MPPGVAINSDSQTKSQFARRRRRAARVIEVTRKSDGKANRRADINSKFDQEFHSAAASIKQAWQAMPDVAQMSDNLIVEETKEGLNIQIVDQDRHARCSPRVRSIPHEVTRKAIAALGPILQKLSNQIDDFWPYRGGRHLQQSALRPWELVEPTAPMWCAASSASSACPDGHVASVSGHMRRASRSFPTTPIWQPMSGSRSPCCTPIRRCHSISSPDRFAWGSFASLCRFRPRPADYRRS